MNFLKIVAVFLLFCAAVFSRNCTLVFGSHWLAESGAELVADGITILILALALLAYGFGLKNK